MQIKADNKVKTVDQHLDAVDFYTLNHRSDYIPSEFTMNFMNFIKLMDADNDNLNSTPVMHLAMLDKLATKNKRIANLCGRGLGKTTLFAENLILYLAVFRKLPFLGSLNGMLYISDSMENGVKTVRDSIETKYHHSEFLQYWLPKARFTEKEIDFTNRNNEKFTVKMYGAKSGIRGSKIGGKRPVLAVMDDLVSDADSKSKVSMEAIKDTVFSGVQFALDPTKFKMILNGTPFNKSDILYEAIEFGQWEANVWPVCEKFPCTKEEFNGAWEDRFSYEYVKDQYEFAKGQNKLKSFNQELMLRISSEESRLIKTSDIIWVTRNTIITNKHEYNFYITTDFATSSKQTADFSVISVWAYDKEGNWTWVDGICKRQTMDISMEDLFRFVNLYQPQSVGIEISGQQGGFISWIQKEMQYRDIYFNLAGDKGKPGIRPVLDKLSRFNLVVPLFKLQKIRFPEEMRETQVINNFIEQISLVTEDGIKGKDDCIDTISMLQNLNPWKPDGNSSPEDTNIEGPKTETLWEDHYNMFDQPEYSGIGSYIT